MNNLDYAFIALIGGLMIWGLTRGFISAATGLVGYFAAIVAAKLWGSTVGNFLNTTELLASVRRSISSSLASIGIAGFDPGEAVEVLRNTEFGQILAREPMLQKLFSEGEVVYGSTGLSDMIVSMTAVAIGYLLVFAVVKLLVSLIGTALSGLARMSKSLTFLNRLAGLLVGGVTGVAISAVIVAYIFPMIISYDVNLYTMAQTSVIAELLQSVVSLFM